MTQENIVEANGDELGHLVVQYMVKKNIYVEGGHLMII